MSFIISKLHLPYLGKDKTGRVLQNHNLNWGRLAWIFDLLVIKLNDSHLYSEYVQKLNSKVSTNCSYDSFVSSIQINCVKSGKLSPYFPNMLPIKSPLAIFFWLYICKNGSYYYLLW